MLREINLLLFLQSAALKKTTSSQTATTVQRHIFPNDNLEKLASEARPIDLWRWKTRLEIQQLLVDKESSGLDQITPPVLKSPLLTTVQALNQRIYRHHDSLHESMLWTTIASMNQYRWRHIDKTVKCDHTLVPVVWRITQGRVFLLLPDVSNCLMGHEKFWKIKFIPVLHLVDINMF